jgi:hypothetical protein
MGVNASSFRSVENAMSNKPVKASGKNIFFRFGNGEREEHILRLVGDFFITKKHWIGPSKFNDYPLYDDEEFDGEDPLPNQITCNDCDDEGKAVDGGCPICQLNANVRNILRSKEAESLEEGAKRDLENLRKKSMPKTHCYINVIDRNDPDYAKDGNGYKIADFNKSIITGIGSIVKDIEPDDIAGIEDGCDIKITKVGNGTDAKYTVSLVLERASVKRTPLTDEEKSWDLHDLKAICGKKIDANLLRDRLADEPKSLLEGEDEGSDGVPF